MDFPGGAVDRNLPANAGDTGLIPDPGRSHVPWNNWAHTAQLLSPSSRACQPQLLKSVHLEPVLHSKGGHGREKHRNEESSPCSLHLKKAHANQWTPSIAKNKNQKKNNLQLTSCSMVKDWMLFPCIKNEARMPTLITFIQPCTKSSSNCNKAKKESKRH